MKIIPTKPRVFKCNGDDCTEGQDCKAWISIASDGSVASYATWQRAMLRVLYGW